MRFQSILPAVILVVAGVLSGARAHDGHDHDAAPMPVPSTTMPRADASSDEFELVAIINGEVLSLYLDRFRTNAPVADAVLELDSPQGRLKATAQGAGLYTIKAPWLDRPGSHDLAITVQAGAVLDILAVTAIIPPATQERARGTRDVAQRFADGSLFVPKPTQHILALRTGFTEVWTYPGTVELPARIIPDPNGSGYVQASVAGRLTAPPGGFPRLGTRVVAGEVLALVQPAVGAADVTSQQQQLRELDQQISLIQRRLERYRQISGVIARSQLEDAELELAGLNLRRANLERAPREPERLVAPVSGVIAAVQAIAGQIATPDTVIFQIIDPARYWVEALSFEAHALRENATGRLADGRSLPLVFRGSGLADRNQAIPVQFEVDADTSGLRAGQLLTVMAASMDERRGIALPRAAVLRGANGQSIVYEHSGAERFVPREVRAEPLDANHVLIVSGVEAGRRIVTQGAELLNQIR